MPRRKTKHYVQIGENTLMQGRSKWKFGERLSVTVPFEGPFEKCMAQRPERGSILAGFNSFGLRVVESEIEEMEGGTGSLTVSLEAALPDPAEVSTDPIGEPEFVLEWVAFERALERHPKCGRISAAGIGAGITSLADEWEKIEANGDYYQNIGDDGWNRTEYTEMKARGVESYEVYYPVIRRTTYHFARPSETGLMCGKRENPPVGSGFDALDVDPPWEWIAGPDSCTRTGRLYRRETEWRGAEKWEPLIYGPVS